MKEHHVFGPPGTGKTTYIAEQVERAVEKFGIHRVMVSSFTRAAAHEIAARSIKLAKNNVGTLHSICWRALDKPPIAESKVEEFNQQYSWQITPTKRVELEERDEPGTAVHRGDKLLESYCLMRNRCESVEEIGTVELKAFARAWEDWKEKNGYLDFCDLIEQAREQLNRPPGEPLVAFIDEAQDLSALEFSLVRRWAEAMEHVVMVGDDDQAIYEWTGADVRNLIETPAESTIVLKRSYRLPRAIHKVASEFIAKCKIRQPKEFQCRDDDGLAVQIGMDADSPALVDLIKDEIAEGHKVMLLASCSYMLHAPLQSLRAAGLPWHNPYRTTNGAWNPIRIGPKSTAHKLWCFLQGEMVDGSGPCWTGAQMERWLQICNDRGLLQTGKRAELLEECSKQLGKPIGPNLWQAYFTPQVCMDLRDWPRWSLDQKLYWFAGIASAKVQKSLEFAGMIARRSGPEALMSVPKLTVGTIHSVKGAEADAVILIPEVSAQAMETACIGSTVRDGLIHAGEALDPLLRVAYVGMTRARERLYVLQPRSRNYKIPYIGKMLPMV